MQIELTEDEAALIASTLNQRRDHLEMIARQSKNRHGRECSAVAEKIRHLEGRILVA